MKIYKLNGLTYQFDENEVPDGAVEVKAAEPKNKAVTPQNKGVRDADSKPAPRAQRKSDS